jgi:NAD(P)-dependent dehydrogenase (short-subunit alcohol dehydrogenase family)
MICAGWFMSSSSSVLFPGFSAPLTVLVVGSSGAIGRALVQQLVSCAQVQQVFAASRGLSAVEAGPGVIPVQVDITDETSVAALARQLMAAGVQLDLIIVATGVLHGADFGPEKSLRQLTPATFDEVMRVNALGPLLVARYCLPLLRRDRPAVFAALSARVGSISDNRLGGWYSYRASKAALNMLLKCFAIECRLRYPQLMVAGVHPGTVDSALSAPFQANVPAATLFSPAQAAGHVLTVLGQLTPADSGKVLAWNGQEIPA